MSNQPLVHDATASTKGTVYQFYVAVQKCFEMTSGQTVLIERYGDVTIDDHEQVETKHYSDPLTDNHLNFWKTLKNWMQDGFDATRYASLLLCTTQQFGANAKIAAWNETDVKLTEARRYIHSAMADIGGRFDFEESYRPINLNFSLESFDLWHEERDRRRVFLRSMGSGANWLYCHLSLFMALHKLFCHLGDSCKIPAILFLDQPSQVYFPSFGVDSAEEFNARELAEKAGKGDRLDEDVRAVENLYSELVSFCEQALAETGSEPQIIVSDHADNLNLAGKITFASLVRARWRTRGFIYPLPEKTL
jgi:hypothetical protein